MLRLQGCKHCVLQHEIHKLSRTMLRFLFFKNTSNMSFLIMAYCWQRALQSWFYFFIVQSDIFNTLSNLSHFPFWVLCLASEDPLRDHLTFLHSLICLAQFLELKMSASHQSPYLCSGLPRGKHCQVSCTVLQKCSVCIYPFNLFQKQDYIMHT